MSLQGTAGRPQGEESGGENRDERHASQPKQDLRPEAESAPAPAVGEGDALAGHTGIHDSTVAAVSGSESGPGFGSRHCPK